MSGMTLLVWSLEVKELWVWLQKWLYDFKSFHLILWCVSFDLVNTKLHVLLPLRTCLYRPEYQHMQRVGTIMFVCFGKISVLSKEIPTSAVHCPSSSERFVQSYTQMTEHDFARFMLSIFSLYTVHLFCFRFSMEALSLHVSAISGCNVQF